MFAGLQSFLIISVLLFTGLSSTVQAQARFPTDAIEVITHAGHGGDTDMAARMMMLQARRELQQDMVIVNKRGGNGSASMKYFDSKVADGHTLLTMTTSHIITMARGKSTLSLKDIQPIARGTNDPLILMTSCRLSAFNTGTELIETMKNKVLAFGTTNTLGIDHIAAYTFAHKGGLTQPEIKPLSSGRDIVLETIKGTIDIGVLNYFEAKDKIESGDICPLIVLNATRLPSHPNTQTAMELGIDTAISSTRGYVTHATTSETRANILSEKLVRAMNHPVYQAYLPAIGLDSASVANAREWNTQLTKMMHDIQPALDNLGLR